MVLPHHMIRTVLMRDGAMATLDLEKVQDIKKVKDYIFVEVDEPTGNDLSLIQDKFSIDPLEIEDIQSRGQRPKVEDYEDHLFVVVHSLELGEEELFVNEVYIMASRNWVIVVHWNNPCVKEVISKYLRMGLVRTAKLSPDFVFFSIVDRIVDRYFELLNRIGEIIVELEEEAEENPTRDIIARMSDIRRILITFRRTVWPTREMLWAILKGIYPIISDENLKYFRDVYDHIAKIIDMIDSQYSQVGHVGEVYMASLSVNTNEIMKIFTVIASIFMPPTLIASIYGMNFRNMPELTWEHGYPFALLLMLLSTLIPLIIIKWRKYL